MSVLRMVVAFAFMLVMSVAQAINIPVGGVNGKGYFLRDYAHLLKNGGAAEQSITAVQREAFETKSTPIVIVTINRMRDYGYGGKDVHHFSRLWFNKWEIGTERTNHKNAGILLLVSKGDRMVSIQLGNDWRHNWDSAAQAIIDEKILPAFREKDFGGGIAQGVEALGVMAKFGPEADPARFSPSGEELSESEPDSSQPSVDVVQPDPDHAVSLQPDSTPDSTPVSTESLWRNPIVWMIGLCFGLGFALVILGIVEKDPEKRSQLIKYGVILMVLPLALIALLAAFSGRSRGASNASSNASSGQSSRSEGGYSGGGFSGGSSGSGNDDGGGASGSW
ncbi:TPM domain-containing protein [Jeongeupia wiesaeckerbachi]|uniref:TPM domain-containing protein n=1 Tax=Jeongeupia wiesaeckerbachi TaxID=3051218 RepID=UPI003D802E2F